jgi:hypothetical protein
MNNYLLLYSGGKMPETEKERKEITADWIAWYTKLDGSVVDQGNPFTPKVKSISSDGKIVDGPIGSMASGYSVIKASSLDEAVKLANGCPVLKGGAKISVYETFNAMG